MSQLISHNTFPQSYVSAISSCISVHISANDETVAQHISQQFSQQPHLAFQEMSQQTSHYKFAHVSAVTSSISAYLSANASATISDIVSVTNSACCSASTFPNHTSVKKWLRNSFPEIDPFFWTLNRILIGVNFTREKIVLFPLITSVKVSLLIFWRDVVWHLVNAQSTDVTFGKIVKMCNVYICRL